MTSLRQETRPRDIAQEVVRLYLDGAPIKQIVAATGVNTRKIYEILRAYGVGPSRRRGWSKRRVTRDEVERIKRMYMEGASVYEIARRLGRSVSTVYYVLKKLGLK